MQRLSTKYTTGFTLIEALVATVIVGLGFVGVYSLAAASEQSMQRALHRQKLQLVANQILEVIAWDVANIDQYNDKNLSVCTAPNAGETALYSLRPYQWCSMLRDELGASAANDTRNITVTTLPDGKRVVHLALTADDGITEIVMKRVYDILSE